MIKNNRIIKQNKNNQFSEFLIYKSPNGELKVDVFIKDENIWLTQDKIAFLFGVDRTVITKHIKNIYEDNELEKNSTSAKFAQVQNEGDRSVKRELKYYNLDIIISVGYRVNSLRATQFRIWANKVLKEYIIKGFAMNDDRLKNPNYVFGKDYFEEQLARIREIRASERRFYQKITDIYAQCSIDYEKESEITKKFYATVQNKLHWAITGQTAAEIIHSRVDSKKPHMGLKTWKNSPKGKIRQEDSSIAKNYLGEQEIDLLNRIVSMYLDYAEIQALERKAMTMQDWVDQLDKFLNFQNKDILTHLGSVSAKLAQEKAENEFKKYKIIQDQEYISDFEKEIKKYLK